MANAALSPGWYVELLGERFDLEDWVYTLNEPFDPVAFEEPDGQFLLKSADFAGAADVFEVREKAIGLIDRLNGGMALMHGAQPVRIGAIIQVDGDGKRTSKVIATAAMSAVARAKARATAIAFGPDGNPLPSPPPHPSKAQFWNEWAARDDNVADLLEQLGRADGWYEIYKTIELAEVLAGGHHKLKALLGPSLDDCLNMRRTANFYRHARAPRPQRLITIQEAKPLLRYIVQTVLDLRQ